MSVERASRVNASRPSSVFRLRTMLRLPRLRALKPGLSVPTAPGICRVESPAGGSTLMRSAPRSASSIAQNGPAITCVTSSTRRPSRADDLFIWLLIIWLFDGGIAMHTIFETDGPLAFLTFNRPEARNAMTWEMYESLVDACDRVDRDAALRVLILRGAGDKAFVAGTDIAQFQHFTDRE